MHLEGEAAIDYCIRARNRAEATRLAAAKLAGDYPLEWDYDPACSNHLTDEFISHIASLADGLPRWGTRH